MPNCVALLFVTCTAQVVPRVKELANDSSQFVRAALAGVVMELAPQLGKQPTIEHLVPVFLNLLRDPYPDVRLNVISKLDQVRHCNTSCGHASRRTRSHSSLALCQGSPCSVDSVLQQPARLQPGRQVAAGIKLCLQACHTLQLL
jgi:hypothetical protein